MYYTMHKITRDVHINLQITYFVDSDTKSTQLPLSRGNNIGREGGDPKQATNAADSTGRENRHFTPIYVVFFCLDHATKNGNYIFLINAAFSEAHNELRKYFC